MGWTFQCSISGRDKRSVPSPKRPDRLWGTLSLLFSGYAGMGLKWQGRESDLHAVPRLRTNGALPPLPLYAFVACTGTTLPLPLP
jgi:hypothetical protein